jgi:hypothetical protein
MKTSKLGCKKLVSYTHKILWKDAKITEAEPTNVFLPTGDNL